MIIFTGQKLGDWHKVWGFWFRHRYFVGFSIAAPAVPKTDMEGSAIDE